MLLNRFIVINANNHIRFNGLPGVEVLFQCVACNKLIKLGKTERKKAKTLQKETKL